MKIKNIQKLFALILLSGGLRLRADLFDFGLGKAEIDVVIGDRKEEDIRHLKSIIDDYKNNDQKEQEEFQAKVLRIKSKIDQLEHALGVGSFDQFTQQKLVNLQSCYQILAEIKNIKKEYFDIIKHHLDLLEAYVNEEQQEFIESGQKVIYSFDELQVLTRKIMSQDDKCAHIISERNEVTIDLENSKKRVVLTQKTYDQKVFEENQLRKTLYSQGNSVSSKADLLDTEKVLAQYENELVLAKVTARSAKLNYLNDAVSIEQKKLQKLKKIRDMVIARALRVDQQDIESAQKKMNTEKHRYLALNDQHLQRIEYYSNQQEVVKKELQLLNERYADTEIDTQGLDEWTGSPITVQGHIGFIDKGLKRAESNLIDSQIEYQRAVAELEKTKYKEFELNLKIVQSWFNIKHQKFGTSDKLLKNISQYQESAAEFNREKSMYDDKRYALINRLNFQNHSLSNIKVKLEELTSKGRLLFKREEQAYHHCIDQLHRAQILLTRQIELTGHLIETYSTILMTLGGYEKQIAVTISELQRASLWQRSGGVISREGLQNSIPDIYSFFVDVVALGATYIDQFSISSVVRKVASYVHSSYLLFLLLQILTVLLLFVLFRRYGLYLAELFLEVEPEYPGAYFFSRLAAVFLQFIHTYQMSIVLWLFSFWFIVDQQFFDVYPTIIFYLFSIPYLLNMARLFIGFTIKFNRDHDFQLFPGTFEHRFIFSIGTLLYATIALLFFREAFVAVTYIKSELPGIILAIYSIVVRVILLSLIRKEDLLSIIPPKTMIGSWLWRIVDKYYYALFAAVVIIMILSDAHIGGYDNLISYLLLGIIGTLVISRVLFLLYAFTRRTTSHLFFSFDDESTDERFQHAKTWYGLFVIILFGIFVIIGIVAIAWCWGKSIPLNSFFDFFSAKNLAIGFKDGQHQRMSVLDLIRIVLYLPGSFLVAYLVDKFVLHRIYMILLVEPGVHNAVSTISYYSIVILVITLGLCQEGFGFLVSYYVLPILFGMVWAVRDVFNDFVAYFVLLIQRPIKVGDYIKISDEVKGVVRKMTPRTVVLRREQSYHLIIPNSKLMQEVVFNWDYTRSFIAFPDIHIGVRYSTDPELVKKILAQAVDNVLNVLKIPPPIIRLDEFGPSGFVFLVRGFISSEMTLEQWNIASDVRFSIVRHLHKNNIELAYPVRIIRTIGQGQELQYLESQQNDKV